MPTGTHDINTLKAARFQSVAEFGVDTVNQILAADIAAHNLIVTELVGDLCEITTDRQRIYGTSANGDMQEVDEYGRAPSAKQTTGSTVGFPLKLFQYNLGWTSKWLQTRTPADAAEAVQHAQKAHLRVLTRDIKRAIFNATNYTHRDHLVDNVDLAVKRFVNADSAAIPDGPNGETFDAATHTHYNAAASLAAADLTALIEDVVEHGHGGKVIVAINRSNEAAVRALTGFTAYIDPRLVMGTQANQPGEKLDITRLDNRAIGLFGAAEVWVKPWAIANYAVCYDAGAAQKPLAFRQRSQVALQGLRIAAEESLHPLTAQFMEAEFGVGVWTRTNGAVLYFASGTYSSPTIS